MHRKDAGNQFIAFALPGIIRVAVVFLMVICCWGAQGAFAQTANAMLAAAKARDEAAVMATKQQIEARPKTRRGDRRTARSLNKKGLSLVGADRYREAVNLFKRGTAADPGDVEVLNNLGYAQLKAGLFSEAKATLLRVLFMTPGRTSAWANLAEAHGHLGAEPEASAALRLAFRFSGNQQKTIEYLERIKATPAAPRALAVAVTNVLEDPRIGSPGVLPGSKRHWDLEATRSRERARPAAQGASSPTQVAAPSPSNDDKQSLQSANRHGRANTASSYVRVTGYGATPGEARNEAVRLALQKTMKQLILVDRRIENDELVLDRLLSTMNGFVEDFREIRLQQEGDQYRLEADIKVSPTRVENFLVSENAKGSAIKGRTLFAEARRATAQRETQGEMIARAFRGFPKEAVDIQAESVGLSNEDPELLEIALRLKLNSRWLNQLEETISEIAIEKTKRIRKSERYKYTHVCFPATRRWYAGDHESCYMLPEGLVSLFNRGSNQRFNEMHSALYGSYNGSWLLYVGAQFVDRDGRTVHRTDDNCIYLGLSSKSNKRLWGGRGYEEFFTFYLFEVNQRVKVPVANIDLYQVDNLVAVPVMRKSEMSRGGGLFIGDITEISTYRDGQRDFCSNDVDEAVQKLLVSR